MGRTAIKSQSQLERGGRFGRYVLLEKIAESLMSEVFLAVRADEQPIKRFLAIKKLHPFQSSSPRKRQLFFEEIGITASLSHPNIVQIHDYGEEKGEPFIAMEWVHGRSLRQVTEAYRATSGKTMPLEAAITLMLELAETMAYFHGFIAPLTGESVNVLHRDISPQNLLVTHEGHLKLIDFGISTLRTGADQTASDQVQGKPNYLAPEQLAGEKADQRSDVFSAGCVFYELITGEQLFAGDSNFAIFEQIRNADQAASRIYARIKGLSPELARILVQCLRRERGMRYQFAHRLAADLQRVLADLRVLSNAPDIKEDLHRIFADDLKRERRHQLDLLERNAISADLEPASEPESELELDLALYQEAKLKPDRRHSPQMPPELELEVEVPVEGVAPAEPEARAEKVELEAQPPRASRPIALISKQVKADLVEMKPKRRAAGRPLRILQALLVLGSIGAAYWFHEVRGSSSEAIPGFAWINLDIQPSDSPDNLLVLVDGQAQFMREEQLFVPTNQLVRIKILRAGYVSQEREFTVGTSGPYRAPGDRLLVKLTPSRGVAAAEESSLHH